MLTKAATRDGNGKPAAPLGGMRRRSGALMKGNGSRRSEVPKEGNERVRRGRGDARWRESPAESKRKNRRPHFAW